MPRSCAQLLQPAEGGKTSAALRINFSGRVWLEPTISPEINRGVMHAVEGAWRVSVESQWLMVFGVVGRPLNAPPPVCFVPQAKPEQTLRRNGQRNGRLAAVKHRLSRLREKGEHPVGRRPVEREGKLGLT